MKLKHLLQPLLMSLAPPLGLIYLHLMRTCRLSIVGIPEIVSKKGIAEWPDGIIYCSWHSRLFYWGRLGKDTGTIALISASKDGEIISKILCKVGIYSIRGSSSRGGQEALRQAVELLNNNGKIYITGDGPRGPRHELKAGPIRMAQLTGRPIFPLSWSVTRGCFLPSWDRFLVPFPKSKIVIVLKDPLFIPAEMTEDEFEAKRLHVQNLMIEAQEEADRLCGRDPEKETLWWLRKKKRKTK